MGLTEVFYIQLFIVFISDGASDDVGNTVLEDISKSVGLCSDNGTNNYTPLLLITFGSGSNPYSKKTPADFNFSTNYHQELEYGISPGKFGFVNAIPHHTAWHIGALDHTENDVDGYMYLVDVGEYNKQLFKYMVNDLCLGMRYDYSAYLGNVVVQTHNSPKPNIRFEVRNATVENHLLAQFNTSEISEYDTMTWSKYGLSFLATSTSVVLLMISNVGEHNGNDIAIDDIELRVCSADHSEFCPPGPKSTLSFVPHRCNDSRYIGSNCSILSNLCDMMKPCENGGICKGTPHDYTCLCPSGFNGTRCELDRRPCKPHTCLNDGRCHATSSTEFNCICVDGWQGVHCESMINFCDNNTCENNGVCRPLLLNYTCECLGESYFGRHCQNTTKRIVIYQIVCKSFAYVAIIAMASTAMFIIIMDILRYCFGIDPVRRERERMRQRKQTKKRKRPVIQRFTYVNTPSTTSAEPV